jgi:hypothetical protein
VFKARFDEPKMIWWKRGKQAPLLSEALLGVAKQARNEAAQMPPGDARDQLLNRAEASELAVIEAWLSPLGAAER